MPVCGRRQTANPYYYDLSWRSFSKTITIEICIGFVERAYMIEVHKTHLNSLFQKVSTADPRSFKCNSILEFTRISIISHHCSTVPVDVCACPTTCQTLLAIAHPWEQVPRKKQRLLAHWQKLNIGPWLQL